MFGYVVLLKDEHFTSNAGDQWQQFLHQQQVSVILPVGLSPGLMKMRLI